MLIDHTAAALRPELQLYIVMRIIGRIAFPIYCFLLAEGAHYTRSPRRYGLRLGIGMVLSELPFDFALFGGMTLRYQNVMMTMVLGFLALCAMKKCSDVLMKILTALPFVVAAELLQTDYGGWGVVLIVLFALVREAPHSRLWQLVSVALFCWGVGGLEKFGVEAMAFIALYHGGKHTHSKAVQWGFYLFYPVHLTVLAILARI